MWDARKKGVIHTFQSMYQVTAVAFNDTAEQIFSGGIDNDVKVSQMWLLAGRNLLCVASIGRDHQTFERKV